MKTQQEQINELQEQLTKLRERVAVLELRTMPLVQIGQRVPLFVSQDQRTPPFTVTCEAAKQGGQHDKD